MRGEAVVFRERIETVIEAVEHETGHVGVTRDLPGGAGARVEAVESRVTGSGECPISPEAPAVPVVSERSALPLVAN